MKAPPVGVLVFARAPQPGRVKTRLARRIGNARACATYVALVERTLSVVQRSRLPAELWIDGPLDDPRLRRWAHEHALSLHQQRGHDLGARMRHALEQGLRRYRACLIIGTDCATLDAHELREAARHVRRSRAVLAPSWDGGYVLLGLPRPEPAVFERVPWSTRQVHALTRRRLSARGWQVRALRHQHDVDHVDDLRWMPAVSWETSA